MLCYSSNIVILEEDDYRFITMEFIVKQKEGSLCPSKDGSDEWTVEECENYVRENESLPPKERRPPLHEILKGCTIQVKEETPVAVVILVEN